VWLDENTEDAAHAEVGLTNKDYIAPGDKITPDGIEAFLGTLALVLAGEATIAELETRCRKS
jgi:hypothetical protein